MSLTLEWSRRIDIWRQELRKHFYLPLEPIAWRGFTTLERLEPREASSREFRPVPSGTKWGAMWEYGWFRADVRVPERAAGQWVVARVELGGESLYHLDGRAVGRHHWYPTSEAPNWWEHPFVSTVELEKRATMGRSFTLLVETYAGHGPTPVSMGPVLPGAAPFGEPFGEPFSEPQDKQATVGDSSVGIWDDEAYQLFVDVNTLWQLRGNLDGSSLRQSEIDAGLRDFATILDFETSLEKRRAAFKAARSRLKPLLDCRNGSTAPTLFAVGHAHIDVAWLWPLQQTWRKTAITFANQLTLAEEYPEHRFLQSTPQLYQFAKTMYPELYARVREAVRRGQIIPDGGMWVEADTNISGGESLIRQFLYGKRFFREEFGVDNELLWLPDVFGYSGALPQILRGCGVKYFATAKIYWAYNGGDPFPHTTFVWEGIDGSEVFVNLMHDYNSLTTPNAVIARWNERPQKDGISTRLMPFGFGDGGGGPNRDHLEYLRRQADLEGVPRIRIAPPAEYFRDQGARGWPEVRYVGELYFQAHRGTYTSQARTKRGNRLSELALREAELWGAAARALAGFAYPAAQIELAWKNVLLNQFHDIIPGSSIERVYREAEALHAQTIATARGISRAARSALCRPEAEASGVFNSLGWERKALVELPEGAGGAADAAGTELPAQTSGGRTWVELSVPACGWTTLTHLSGDPAIRASGQEPRAAATERGLENELLRVNVGERGELTSIVDKETGCEWAAGPCNELRMYQDIPTAWDAWDIDSTYKAVPVRLEEPARIEPAASGPLFAALRLQRRINDSTIEQEIRLRRGSRTVELHTVIDWRERHKLLKVNFPVRVHAHEAVHEIQFGHIRRPNHASRQFDADRFEVCNHKWTALVEEGRGCAVLNDCKYGINVEGNSMNLTLLKSALAPDAHADQGRQELTYAFTLWNGSLADCAVVREAYELNCPVESCLGAAGTASLLSVDAPNIVIETVKAAEDGTADIVVRMYEAKRTATRCALSSSLPLAGAVETDMLEDPVAPLTLAKGKVVLDFRAFEVKTVKLKR